MSTQVVTNVETNPAPKAPSENPAMESGNSPPKKPALGDASQVSAALAEIEALFPGTPLPGGRWTKKPITLPRPKAVAVATKPRPIHDVSPSEDFLTDYLRFADYLEMPTRVHAAMAMSAVTAVANPNVVIWNGDLKISLDLWQILLKASGTGKNSVLGPFNDVLEAADLADLISNVGFGSFSHAMQHFSRRPNNLLILPEMSATLEDWRHKQFAGLIPWTTNLYDEFRIPKGKEYRERADQDEEKQTPAIIFKKPPRVGILGMSAESWFFRSMQRDDVKGGFLPRFVVEWVQEKGRRIATPWKPAQSLGVLPRLATRLQQIRDLKGDMRLTKEAQARYERWYSETADRFERFSNQAVAEPIWHRHRVHLFKFAAIYELSSSAQLAITLPSLERAIAHARNLEPTIVKIAGVQLSHNGAERQEIEDYLEEGKADGRSRRDVFRNLRGKTESEKLDILRGLMREETIFRFSRKTSGRSAEDYVHHKFVKEYRETHKSEVKALGTNDPF